MFCLSTSEAFSFQIATDNREETDCYCNAIVGNGGAASACDWCKDRCGLSWQITPRVLTDALAAGGSEAKRAFEAMMTMTKMDIAAIEAARRADANRSPRPNQIRLLGSFASSPTLPSPGLRPSARARSVARAHATVLRQTKAKP